MAEFPRVGSDEGHLYVGSSILKSDRIRPDSNSYRESLSPDAYTAFLDTLDCKNLLGQNTRLEGALREDQQHIIPDALGLSIHSEASLYEDLFIHTKKISLEEYGVLVEKVSGSITSLMTFLVDNLGKFDLTPEDIMNSILQSRQSGRLLSTDCGDIEERTQRVIAQYLLHVTDGYSEELRQRSRSVTGRQLLIDGLITKQIYEEIVGNQTGHKVSDVSNDVLEKLRDTYLKRVSKDVRPFGNRSRDNSLSILTPRTGNLNS